MSKLNMETLQLQKQKTVDFVQEQVSDIFDTVRRIILLETTVLERHSWVDVAARDKKLQTSYLFTCGVTKFQQGKGRELTKDYIWEACL